MKWGNGGMGNSTKTPTPQNPLSLRKSQQKLTIRLRVAKI
ncbi:hypothetical protein VL20_2560 [Microcystis panniformis FACHB-1757]|uniref:Uncharacterized protein n=1 Tax=Microcystis panniformis FACHB-1757 TaxID=1638788 RepID=A0A0K1S0W4_9CHRO|nr:hypothetical protein VL20_2560 [Microcystis panniformis FACHB-1757]